MCYIYKRQILSNNNLLIKTFWKHEEMFFSLFSLADIGCEWYLPAEQSSHQESALLHGRAHPMKGISITTLRVA